MTAPQPSPLRKIPSVDLVLQEAEAEHAGQGLPRRILADCARRAVEEVRERLRKHLAQMGTVPFFPPGTSDASPEAIRADIFARLRQAIRAAAGPHYRKVINATGIILHTALGRAVLPAKALRQIEEELSGYSLLQADVATGQRSRRDERIQWLLAQLTGAEAATVVNNNAAATSIVLNTVANGKEVIVSRGQLVEIGGSFRLPEVMAASGAKLVEVGTTNKTHPTDYERAITPNTAAILRVHPSNYKITGFTSEVPLEELVRIARQRNVLVIDDVGAGALIDFSRFGFDKEPTLRESIQAGADLVTCSADKLIGGAQGGIILGKADLVQAVRKNPMARIVRVGKLTLAALEATLTLFLDERVALREVPTLRMLCRSIAEIAGQAERIAAALAGRVCGAEIAVIEGYSQTGSGSLPTQGLATRLVAVTPRSISPDELARRLRQSSPPIFARIHKGQVLLDPRTLLEGEEEVLVNGLVEVLSKKDD